jgi:hypothetical protein
MHTVYRINIGYGVMLHVFFLFLFEKKLLVVLIHKVHSLAAK